MKIRIIPGASPMHLIDRPVSGLGANLMNVQQILPMHLRGVQS